MPGLLGISLGGSGGGQSSSESGTKSNTYTPEQTGLMQMLGGYFQSLMPSMQSGTLNPQVQAQKTASADAINQNYSSLGDRMNRFLSSRGYGKSGVAGKAQLQGELGRQGDLAGNESNFAGLQLNQNQSTLLSALNYAFNPTGQTSSGQSSGTEWGFGAGVGGSFKV